ncbi:MAG TPA: tetratricopeptide repeat protein [Acidobacteriota bacterium]|jgi:tetratricopeptide (TPR) repeat protein
MRRRLLPLMLLFSLLLPGGLLAQVQWVKSFDAATKQAAADGKFIVLDISASWCPPCQEMARTVYPSSQFIEFSKTQVFMLLDAETESEGVRLARRYNVEAYPTILILDAKGREIERLTGGRDTKEFIDELSEIFKNPVPFGELVDRARKETGDFALQYKVGKKLLENHDSNKAIPFLQRAGALAASRDASERVGSLFHLSLAYFKSGKYQESLDAIQQLEKIDARLADLNHIRLQKVQALVGLKRYDEADQIIKKELKAARSKAEMGKTQKLLASFPAKYRKGGSEYGGLLAKARENLAKGKADAALDLGKQASEAAPQSAEVHMLLAAAHFRASATENDPARKNYHLSTGLNELRLARRLDPDDLAIYNATKGFLAARLMPQAPSTPEASKEYQVAEALFATQKYGDAIKQYQKVIQLDASFGKAYLHMGDAFFARGNLEEALQQYKIAAEKTPLDPAAYRFAADALTRLKRSDEAKDYLIRSLLADPEYPTIWPDLQNLAQVQGRSLERHAEIIPIQFLMLSVDVNQYDEQMFDAVPPETVPAWREYVKTKLQWRQSLFRKLSEDSFYHTSVREEFDCLQKLVEKWNALKAENSSLRNEDLDFLSRVQRDGLLEAFIYFELFTEEYRKTFETWKQQNAKLANQYIQKYLLGSPQAGARGQYSAAAIDAFNAGLKSHQSGDKEKAAEHYSDALDKEPSMVPALHNLALIYLESDDRRVEARELLKHWAELEPDSATVLGLQAQLAYKERDYEKSRDLLQRAVAAAADPKEKETYERNLANVSQMLSNPSTRGRLRGPNFNIAPGSPLREAADALSRGENEKALTLLTALLPKLTDQQDKDQATLMLAVTSTNLRRWKEARSFLTEYLKNHPEDSTAKTMLEALARIERQ